MSKIVNVIASAIEAGVRNSNSSEMSYIVRDVLSQLDNCHVKVWREDETVKLPTYAKQGDACMDVYVHKIEYKYDGRIVYHTGLHFKLPEDYEMEIRPRSSMTNTLAIMQNAPGTLDEGYTGELMIVHRQLDNIEETTNSYSIPAYTVGDRCAQILVRRRERIIWNVVQTKDNLGQTERGDGGFGSTNK